nr:hypothetical protein [Paenibacillus ginsengihumi]
MADKHIEHAGSGRVDEAEHFDRLVQLVVLTRPLCAEFGNGGIACPTVRLRDGRRGSSFGRRDLLCSPISFKKKPTLWTICHAISPSVRGCASDTA